MTENEKLFEALKTIKEICKQQRGCSKCPLNAEGIGCGIMQNPEDWEIKEPPKPIEYHPFE